jgi:aspartyl-tRNA(Asn)/glutamyl-tRNA(Gln) amidotransferase subunit A
MATKDNLSTVGILTTYGSKIFAHHVPNYDATVVRLLKGVGAIILGKLNMSEFALGATNENAHYGTVRNPWNTKHVSGGSSGGAAAAVAADLCYGAIGTDTGGSKRNPASLCGTER